MVKETMTKCKVCGGPIKRFSFDTLKCICCNEIFNIEGKDIDLLNKANTLRRNKSFTEALEYYQEILKQDPDFPEANWGALLSVYGIDYVEEKDNLTPTLYRPVNTFKITDDQYAVALLNNTFDNEHDHYQARILELEKLRNQIELTHKDLPKYDVFISCKITVPDREIEEKTPEYQWGQLIYKRLSQRGMNVFFSPVSLPATNGPYEPIVYSALQSSRYLIVMASKIEYLESPWIKNEWGRYLDIMKRSSTTPRCKLVIDNQVAKKVPGVLKAVSSHIEHDDRFVWLADLEKAVLAALPEFANVKYDALTGRFLSIDINTVKKPNSKTFKPRTVVTEEVSLPIVPYNPYTVQYKLLNSAYTLEENVETCVRKVEIHLRNAQFPEAKYELNSYLSFLGRTKDRDYKILLLELLIASEAKSVNDFFEKCIQRLNQFDLLQKIIEKLPVLGVKEFLDPLCDYIIRTIKSGSEGNVIPCLTAIAHIQNDSMRRLHELVIRNLPYLVSSPSTIETLANISFPFVASNDIALFIELASELSAFLCKNSIWNVADQVAVKTLQADPQNSKCKLIRLMIRNQANTQEDLLRKLEQTVGYGDIDNLILELYTSGITDLVAMMKKRIQDLMANQQFAVAANWLEIVVKHHFDGRDAYLEKMVNQCKTIPQSDPLFSIALYSLPESNFDFVMRSVIEFVSAAIQMEKFDIATRFCRDFIDYDTSNIRLLNLYLYAHIKTSAFSLEAIGNLTDMTIVERMLVSFSTVYEQEELLTKLINACIGFVSNPKVQEGDNVFHVFDKLLSYVPDLSKKPYLIRKLLLFALRSLEKKLFETAYGYFVTLIRLDSTFHEAYWGILLCKNECRNDDELIVKTKKLDQFPEYTLAIQYAKGDEAAENRYSNTFARQMQSIRANAKPSFLYPILVAIGLAVLLIILLT